MASNISSWQRTQVLCRTPGLKAMVIPREHGAWGMLLLPLATGAVVAAGSSVNWGALALFLVAALSLFWLRTPVEAWLGTSAIKAQTPQERSTVLAVSTAIAVDIGRCRHDIVFDRLLARAADHWHCHSASFCGSSRSEETRTQRPHAGTDDWCDWTDFNCRWRVLRRDRKTRSHCGCPVAGQLAIRRETRCTSCRCASTPAVRRA